MRKLGIPHDGYTFPMVIRLVLLLKESLLCGKMVHCLGIQMGFEADVYFCNTLIDLYVKCECLTYACQVFDEMPQKDLVSWTSIISGYVCGGNSVGAFRLFGEMRMVEVEPNSVTILVLLEGCSSVIEGRQLHGYVVKTGFLIDGSVQNSLLKVYSNTGCRYDAEIIFEEIGDRDVVSWNIMMSSYALSGEIANVVDCFQEMQSEIPPSVETLTSLISVFAEGGHIFVGEQIHDVAIKSGLCDDIMRTALLNLYAECGKLRSSAQIFGEIYHRNGITWSAMMSGLNQNGHFKEAIELFNQMTHEGIQPLGEILQSLLVAYTHMGALQLGKGVHGYLIRNLFLKSKEENIPLVTSIMNMYIRCGSISSARICFDKMATRDLVTWTSLIEGCGIHGQGLEALNLFYQMVEEGVEPNTVTFLSILFTCSHSGLLSEGYEIFYSMKHRFGIEPHLNHYTCMVDLLGRSGKVKEALSIIVKSISFPDSRIWGALLAACRVYGDRKLGEYAAQRFLELEADNAGYYTLLSNIQASAERWDEVEDSRAVMRDKDLIKQPGWSCCEAAKGLIHLFVSDDKTHPRSKEIYETVRCLDRKMQDSGYV